MRHPIIVAEIGASHNGSLDAALDLIDLAAHAGADAVKIQCFTPEQMAEPGVKIEKGPWAGRELLDLYRETHTPRAWHRAIFDYARKERLTPFASVFHNDDVDWMQSLDCPWYKIASFELTDTALIRHVARTHKPLIISTGMATENEIVGAIQSAHRNGCQDITMLKCTSAYPTPTAEANLRTISHLQQWLSMSSKAHPDDWTKFAVGLSDHTISHTAAVVATALGASMIEKHIIRDRSDGGPDAAFSANEHEFEAMVKEVRAAASALGTVHYGPTASEECHLALRRKPGGKRGQ